jgi:hypothetical protein
MKTALITMITNYNLSWVELASFGIVLHVLAKQFDLRQLFPSDTFSITKRKTVWKHIRLIVNGAIGYTGHLHPHDPRY